MQPLHPETLTWTALLGKWIEFAQASVALTGDAEGDRWRKSVPGVINLQAVTFALAELGDLPAEDRPVARDKAEILISDNADKLGSIWGDGQLPDGLKEIIADARKALELSENTSGAFDGRE